MTEPEAAVAIVRAVSLDSVLLIRRTERDTDPWSGHWSFPGGRRDPADYDLLATALRELDEECAVRLRREDLAAGLPVRWARRRTPPFLLVAPFVFQVPAELATILDPNEAAEAQWVPLAAIRDRSRHRLRSVPGMDGHIRFPSLDLAGPPLWGFTYWLLVDWLGLARPVAAAAVAAEVLTSLQRRGLKLLRDWENRTAVVEGPIPAADVLAEFAGPGDHVFAVNRLSVAPEEIRLTSADFEEWIIATGGTGRKAVTPGGA